MGKYIPLAVRQANRAKIALAQAQADIAKLHEVERIRAKVLATPDMPKHEGSAPNYDGGGKPVKYSLWKRFTDSLLVGYAPLTESDSVQIYCIHCQLPFDATLTERIAIGVITEYDDIETVIVNAGVNSYWEDQEVERVRPAIVKGDGCPACCHAYTKAVANAKRLTTRVRYTVNGENRSLMAESINHAASLLAEVMGKVVLTDCKTVPQRQAFLNVRVRVSEFVPNAKRMEREAEHRALALAKLQEIQARTDAITARVLADNLASKKANRRRNLKAILKAKADSKPVRNWLRVSEHVRLLAEGA